MNASRAFINSWRSEQIPPSSRLQWDQYAARVARVQLFRDQYVNRAYDDINRLLDSTRRLSRYKYIRGPENPVTSIVDLYPSLCAGGAIDFDGLKVGAIPVKGADDVLIEAIIQILLWSNWAIEKSTYVREGALTGNSIVKVVDYQQQRKVAGEILPIEFMRDAEVDAPGNVKSYVIEYEQEEETDSAVKTFTYKETYDKKTNLFQTFKDDKPFPFFKDENGKPISEWENPYGFAPLVIVPHKRMTGLQWAVNAYYHIIPQIDEMNDLASVLIDYLRRDLNPSWLFNFNKPQNAAGQEVQFEVGSRDAARAMYVNAENAKAQSLTHEGDAAGAMEYLTRLDASITKNCPERALPQLRESGNLTAPGVQAAFRDGEGRIMEAQANYDNGTVRWIQMAITMAAVRGYDKFRAFNINSFDRGDLAFYIKPRPVIEDKLSKLEELQAWQQSGVDEKVWSLLGATDEEISRFKLEKQQKSMIEITARAQQANPQLTDGTQTTNAPAVRGSKLPTEQATKVPPVTQDELAKIAAMHRKSGA